MFKNLKSIFLTAGVLALSCASAFGAYPDKPVRVVLPFAAGGPLDAVARDVFLEMGKLMNQSFVIDNQGGGAGRIATNMVARAPADGYTLLFAAQGNVILQQLADDKDIKTDFIPIGMVSDNPMVLIVSNHVQAKNFDEFVAYARANPGKINFASGGVGGLSHMGIEMLKARAKIDVVHVPYKGTAQVVADMASNQVQAMFTSIPSVVPMLEANRIRAFGLSSPSNTLKNVPLVSKTVPGLEFSSWYALLAPKGVPPQVVKALNDNLQTVLAAPAFRKKMLDMGTEPSPGTPEQLGAVIDAEYKTWKNLIKQLNINMKN